MAVTHMMKSVYFDFSGNVYFDSMKLTM